MPVTSVYQKDEQLGDRRHPEHKLYFLPVLDLYNGEIVAYETSRRAAFKMVSAMLKTQTKRAGSCAIQDPAQSALAFRNCPTLWGRFNVQWSFSFRMLYCGAFRHAPPPTVTT
ncbi:hypothetical protein B0O95_102211 [Mycetohabitans endofungorum]|uniref:Integrase-like protein n=1 Tax=Mycetohabitans endofungorum TaxID=417203 RepID=A0A2P5KDM4_9BURK|nr:hypothetical protein B0O95_102211 [Mycetohabitans endofungorum]